MAGGVTYHEALIVDELNNDPDFNARVILGGSCIHNTKTYVACRCFSPSKESSHVILSLSTYPGSWMS